MSARNFIRLRGELAEGRKVFQAAQELGVSRDEALGMLCRWLLWVDAHCETAETGLTFEQVGEVIGHSGFCSALEEIGWVSVIIPGELVRVLEFEKYLEPTAKNRQRAAERIAAHRWGKKDAKPAKPAKKGTAKKKGGKQ